MNHIKPLLVSVFDFAINQGLPAIIPLLSAVVGLIGTTLVNAVKVVIGIVQTLLPIVEPVIMGIIGLIKGNRLDDDLGREWDYQSIKHDKFHGAGLVAGICRKNFRV